MTDIQKAQQASIKPTALATALALECLLHGTDSPQSMHQTSPELHQK
jgi:hypothetical protein